MYFIFLLLVEFCVASLGTDKASELTLKYGIPEKFLTGLSPAYLDEISQHLQSLGQDSKKQYCIGSAQAFIRIENSEAINLYEQKKAVMKNTGFDATLSGILHSQDLNFRLIGKRFQKLINDIIVAEMVLTKHRVHLSGVGSIKLLKVRIRDIFTNLPILGEDIARLMNKTRGSTSFSNVLDLLVKQVEQYTYLLGEKESLGTLGSEILSTLDSIDQFLK